MSSIQTNAGEQQKPTVAFFVTCLVDLFRPSVGMAAVRLIERSGHDVEVPRNQTCCGQPAFNSGDRKTAQALARKVIDELVSYDLVVIPSGSCAGMLRRHYPGLFEPGDKDRSRAESLAAKTFELTEFLHNTSGFEPHGVSYQGRAGYHDSCSSLRDLGVRDEPRGLLANVQGLEMVDLATPEACCGFGGTFCVKYPEISTEMVNRKVDDIVASGADTVVAADLGCLLNIAGRLKRQGHDVKVFHIAEILAGMAEDGGLGAEKGAS